MALVKAGPMYSEWLRYYRQQTGKAPTAVERTEAYFCSLDTNRPRLWWMKDLNEITAMEKCLSVLRQNGYNE